MSTERTFSESKGPVRLCIGAFGIWFHIVFSETSGNPVIKMAMPEFRCSEEVEWYRESPSSLSERKVFLF